MGPNENRDYDIYRVPTYFQLTNFPDFSMTFQEPIIKLLFFYLPHLSGVFQTYRFEPYSNIMLANWHKWRERGTQGKDDETYKMVNKTNYVKLMLHCVEVVYPQKIIVTFSLYTMKFHNFSNDDFNAFFNDWKT